MKKLFLLASILSITSLGQAQKISSSPFGGILVLISVQELGLTDTDATYANICNAAEAKGYELWPVSTDPDNFLSSLQELLGTTSAYLATDGPVRQEGHEFLYNLSYRGVMDYGSKYFQLRYTRYGFVDTSIYPPDKWFLFKKS